MTDKLTWGDDVKATAIIEDFTALGTISSVAALDVLHGMGLTTAVLPAMMLSSSTEGFGIPERMRTDDWINRTYAHWQSLKNLQIENVLVGYLGTKAMVDKVATLAEEYRWQNLLVDPVMADDGKLYDGFSADYPKTMLQLARLATVMTPNWTELQLLNGVETVTLTEDDDLIAQQVHQLRNQGVTATIVVTGIERQGKLGALTFVANQSPTFCGSTPYPGHFYGTGDTFSALVMGYLVSGKSIQEAVSHATVAIDVAVAETAAIPTPDRVYGMKTRQLLRYLTTEFH